MENLQIADPIERSRQLYTSDCRVASIEEAEALDLGRAITERQCRVLGANVLINSNRDASVNTLLWQIDNSHKYHRKLEQDPNTFIGPYYQRSGDVEICIAGIAVWQQKP